MQPGQGLHELRPIEVWAQKSQCNQNRDVVRTPAQQDGPCSVQQIHLHFYFEHPFAANSLSPRWELDKFKSAIFKQALNLIKGCFVPMISLWRGTFHGLMKRPRLSIMG